MQVPYRFHKGQGKDSYWLCLCDGCIERIAAAPDFPRSEGHTNTGIDTWQMVLDALENPGGRVAHGGKKAPLEVGTALG